MHSLEVLDRIINGIEDDIHNVFDQRGSLGVVMLNEIVDLVFEGLGDGPDELFVELSVWEGKMSPSA